jgi:hypothetical protein
MTAKEQFGALIWLLVRAAIAATLIAIGFEIGRKWGC